MRCSIRVAVLVTLCAASAGAHAASESLAFLAPQPNASTAGVPDDRTLEAKHARIGRIEVRVDDVFETRESRLAAPYRLANSLHISTREDTITDQLLFRAGEPFQRRLLAETERGLRDRRYLSEASVEPVRDNEDDNTVDVVVHVHDVWTLSPGISFGRKGGTNSTRFEFEDTNFLGLGKQISLERADNVDRTSTRLAYVDPNVFGSWWRLSVAHAAMSDGAADAVSLGRPFYSLDSHWSFGASYDDASTTESRYSLGHIVDQFDMQHTTFELGGGWSEGIHDGWIARYLGGVRYDRHDFSAVPGAGQSVPAFGAVPVPVDRVLAYPWVGIEVLEDQFQKTHNLDQIGRTEDLHLGRSARFEAGYASTAFGSTRDAFLLNGRMQMASQVSESQFLTGLIGFGSRFEDDELTNAKLDVGVRWYLRHSPQRMLFASATATVADRLDPEEQLQLGGDNGLRGYPLRYEAGTARGLFTIEERFYTHWQPLKLVNVGAAVFFDAGRTWGRDDSGLRRNDEAAPSPGLLKDIGVGLRLGSARSGLGNVLHIDLAYPLDGERGIDKVQFLIETKQSF
jgi:outer membrane protein assembly factor BamA